MSLAQELQSFLQQKEKKTNSVRAQLYIERYPIIEDILIRLVDWVKTGEYKITSAKNLDPTSNPIYDSKTNSLFFYEGHFKNYTNDVKSVDHECICDWAKKYGFSKAQLGTFNELQKDGTFRERFGYYFYFN